MNNTLVLYENCAMIVTQNPLHLKAWCICYFYTKVVDVYALFIVVPNIDFQAGFTFKGLLRNGNIK
ncbi:MAG: hypothetical protein DRI97_12685 [Bacteroidetes bacterium]|nr:MAG: hypothetical protein DRI97_12685 [Bacteroidota bacterium]